MELRVYWEGISQRMENNRPDVVVVDREKKRGLIVDFAVPSDRNVTVKKEENITKYSPWTIKSGSCTACLPALSRSLRVVGSSDEAVRNSLKEWGHS